MKAKISTLPLSDTDLSEHEFTAKANALLREFDAILARTRRTSERIGRLKSESRRLSVELRKG